MGTNIHESSIDSKEIASRLQRQLEMLTEHLKNLNTSTVHPPSDNTTPDITELSRPNKREDFEAEHLATQKYGLTSPPDFISVSRASKITNTTSTQDAPESLTKFPQATTDAKHDPPTFESSGVSLKQTTKGTRSEVKFGGEECASPPQPFNFNFIPPTCGLDSSSDAFLKPNPTKMTNFGVEFGRKQNTTKAFKFESFLSSSSKTESQKDSKANANSKTIDTVSRLALYTSSASNTFENLGLKNISNEDQLEIVQPSPISLSTLSPVEKVKNSKTLALIPKFLKALKLFNILNILD